MSGRTLSGLADASAALAGEGISMSQVMEKMQGGSRTDDQIARDGAQVVRRQIADLKQALDLLDRKAAHVIRTGQEPKGDTRAWNRVARAADALLEDRS